MQKNKIKSLIHFQFIVFIFGFTAILGSLISIDSIELVWYRMTLASIVLLLYAFIFKKKITVSKSLMFKLLFSGMIIALHWITFFKAIKVSNVSITLSILSLGAFITSILEPLFYKRKIILYEVIFGLIIVIGMSLIFNSQYQYIEGIIYALISVLLSVFFGLINGKLINKASSLVISIYELIGGVFLISLLLLFSNDFNNEFFKLSEDDFFWLLILATVCTAYAFVISVDVLKHLTPYSLMLSINMEPVYGIILAIVFLNEFNNLSFDFYLGFILIFSSVLLNGIFKLKEKKT
ncbi:MAG: EamA family transporter [Flavobacteriaceae bacterium]|jgi:drug/metabolite transporter (DMT)-like permease|nr:EamA family transporter [Flavobacteriaceae bacterium]MBT3794703.1 EamA family transporter [Flavobacteriaceae bacterium]MBT4063470.1 EamA family transporter [Flavobacteriaceae bacterium]MBT4415666.1 EamA family transporter [Flavobacteriaceae bacterium]MBT5011520.1 EamA family transporter [Flavobacteriaceae bacterium]